MLPVEEGDLSLLMLCTCSENLNSVALSLVRYGFGLGCAFPGSRFPGCPGIPDISVTEFPGMKLTQLGVMASCHAFRYSRAPGNPGNDVCAFPIPGNEKTGPRMQTLYLPAPVGRAVLTSASLLTERWYFIVTRQPRCCRCWRIYTGNSNDCVTERCWRDSWNPGIDDSTKLKCEVCQRKMRWFVADTLWKVGL